LDVMTGCQDGGMQQRHRSIRIGGAWPRPDVRSWLGRLIAGVTAAPMLASAVGAVDDDAGKRQFVTSCGTCHTTDPAAGHRQGPNLAGVLGRKAATANGFRYSSALTSSALVWDETTLDHWIEDAQGMLPGTNMLYRQRDPDKRKAIISYLRSLTP
jgi:cytochrome c